MSDTVILALGSGVFAITTLASLWVGYLVMQRQWVAENPELTDESDQIRPLLHRTYPEQLDDTRASDLIASTAKPPVL